MADTWGRETMPVLGPRFLRPFRVHHVNPEDFLRRAFVDTNGDVALMTLPLLVGVFFCPVDLVSGRLLAVLGVSLSVWSLPVNQIHQWAHMRQPPAWVGWLQTRGVMLNRQDHQRHHVAPHELNYCILTGWCNPPLAAMRFFPRVEWLVTRVTGAQPRDDAEGAAERPEAP
jgi:ubiquitin-conjugating enzyme E2 variant